MDKQLAQEVLLKFDRLRDERQSWESEWRDITRYVIPRRSIFDDHKGKAQRVGEEIYDGTAISALNLMANGLVGYLISPMIKWFKLAMPDETMMDIPGVRAWLEYCEQVMYQDFRRSTLYEEILEFFKDGGSIGTAVMYIEEDVKTGVPYFSARHPKEIFIATDSRNRIDTVFRRFWLTARQADEEYGDSLPENIKTMAKEDPTEQVEIIHACYPRKDRDVSKKTPGNKKFASIHVLADEGEVIRTSGYDYFPYVVWRWSTNSDETYGRSPAHDSLVKIKRANRMAKDNMKAGQLAVDPPWNVPEHMRGKVQRIPSGLNYYAAPDELISPVPAGSNYSIGLDQQQDVRAIIEADFLVDFFMMLQRAPERMTATEVMERQAEKAAVLGPIIGRIESDVLDRIVDIAFFTAYNAGRIPTPPPGMLQMVGVDVKIEYMGPLAQSQKKFHVSRGVQQALAAYIPLLEIKPELEGLLKWDELGRLLLDGNGMPNKVIRDADELKKYMQIVAEQMEQQQQQQMQQETMQNYGQLAKGPEAGSPMEGISEQMRFAMDNARGIG